MIGTGWSVVWTPPHDVLVDILGVGLDPEARREALLRAEPRVVEDLDRLIAGVERPELGDLAVATRESL